MEINMEINMESNMEMKYNLNRFVEAQEIMYSFALAEMKNGKKKSHWIWFVFPQLKALGKSPTAKRFGIEDIEEAKAYLNHSILGARLREISEVLLSLESNSPYYVMDGGTDARKLQSSMTLFAESEGYDSVFGKVLDKYYNGKKDMNTWDLLSQK